MRIKIWTNRRKPWAKQTAKEVKRFLRTRGMEVVARNADATICIGGDGTIYYANYEGMLEGKVIGIGSTSSYVCQLKKENWKRKLPVLLRRKGTARTTLEIRWGRRRWRAVADAVLHTHDYRIIRIFGKIESKNKKSRTFSFEGDGIIIATPTGSSGYAYSAGGPKLPIHGKSILIVPISPYKRALKPMELGQNAKIVLWADRTSDLIIDGILIGRIRKGERIRIRSGKPVVFAITL